MTIKRLYFRFTSAGGINFKEEGHLKSAEKSGEGGALGAAANIKMGSVSWTSPEGHVFTLIYEADEQGYRPKLTQLTPPSLHQTEGLAVDALEQQSREASNVHDHNKQKESALHPS